MISNWVCTLLHKNTEKQSDGDTFRFEYINQQKRSFDVFTWFSMRAKVDYMDATKRSPRNCWILPKESGKDQSSTNKHWQSFTLRLYETRTCPGQLKKILKILCNIKSKINLREMFALHHLFIREIRTYETWVLPTVLLRLFPWSSVWIKAKT